MISSVSSLQHLSFLICLSPPPRRVPDGIVLEEKIRKSLWPLSPYYNIIWLFAPFTLYSGSGMLIIILQIIPLHLPPGDTSTERSVYINGLKEQIESAKELINEVISGVSQHSSHTSVALTFFFYIGEHGFLSKLLTF